MERKRVERVVGLMLVMTMLGLPSITAHLPAGSCIEHCLSECKLSGVGVAACIKYCPVHCLSPHTSSKEHYCNLGCMLNQCTTKSINVADEKMTSDCVSNCREYHCKIYI